MKATHIVIIKVQRRSGTTFYNFEANYSANQVAGRIAFGFMKVADSLDESDINLFLFPENNQLMIYDHGCSYEGRITRIGQVDGEPYCGILDDGAKVEFSIKSVPVYTAQEDYEESNYDEEEDEEEDEVPVAHIDGKHLKFKNIPINGTLDEFCAQLDGYELVGDTEHDRIYSGKYAGRDATLYISDNPETGMVYEVIVVLQKWCMDENFGIADIISEEYTKVLNAFKKKYGEEYADERNDFDDESAGDPDYEEEFMQDDDSYVGATFRFESDESQWYSKVTLFLDFVHGDEEEEEDDPDRWYGRVYIDFVDGENEPFTEDDEEEDEDEDGEIDIDEL